MSCKLPLSRGVLIVRAKSQTTWDKTTPTSSEFHRVVNGTRQTLTETSTYTQIYTHTPVTKFHIAQTEQNRECKIPPSSRHYRQVDRQCCKIVTIGSPFSPFQIGERKKSRKFIFSRDCFYLIVLCAVRGSLNCEKIIYNMNWDRQKRRKLCEKAIEVEVKVTECIFQMLY